jgi:hypothetical protein
MELLWLDHWFQQMPKVGGPSQIESKPKKQLKELNNVQNVRSGSHSVKKEYTSTLLPLQILIYAQQASMTLAS